MKQMDRSILVGLALIAAGALFLLENMGFFGPLRGVFWALIFGAGGAAFLLVLARDPAQWWAAIPGFALLGIGLLIAMGDFAPGFAAAWGGAFFLAMLGLGFWTVYLICRACWWAVIPGGVLFTLALVAGIGSNGGGDTAGWMFFLGLAATFGLLYLLPTPQGRMRWAIYPAAGLLAMALLVWGAMGQMINLIWPAALILAGIYLMYRTLRPRRVKGAPR